MSQHQHPPFDPVALAERVAACYPHKETEDILSAAWIGVDRAQKIWKEGLAPLEAFAFILGTRAVEDQLRVERNYSRGNRQIPEDEDVLLPPTDLGAGDPEESEEDILAGLLGQLPSLTGTEYQLAQSLWVDGASLENAALATDLTVWEARAMVVRLKERIRRMVG